MKKEQLTRKNFDWKEFFESNTAKLKNINNTTDDTKLLENGAILADKIQEIREILGYPIKINSAYRCLQLNRIIGSKDTSQHIKFEAVDFNCDSFGNPEKIVLFLKDRTIEVDQCLVEQNGKRSWVHLSIKKERNRNQFGRLINGNFSFIDS
jgi:zinc D-Ala-D-Ala carboxypeptidase